MECVRIRDNNSSLNPTENSAASPIQANPFLLTPNGKEFDAEYPEQSSLSPSTENFKCAEKSRFSSLQSLRSKFAGLAFEPPRPKPLFRGFERPEFERSSFSRIAILTVLSLITYPAFYVLTSVAKDRSLFTVRLIVSTWCSGAGFALGYILLSIGAQHLEAASEFTLGRY